MKTYTDYVFYSNTYKGNMPEDDFNKLVIRASYEVQKNIFNRDITGYEDEVQLATCSVADILSKIETLENKKDTTISENKVKSESVGDYSRTLESATISDIEVEISSQKEKIKERYTPIIIIHPILSHPSVSRRGTATHVPLRGRRDIRARARERSVLCRKIHKWRLLQIITRFLGIIHLTRDSAKRATGFIHSLIRMLGLFLNVRERMPYKPE